MHYKHLFFYIPLFLIIVKCDNGRVNPLDAVPDDHPLNGEPILPPPIIKGAVTRNGTIKLYWPWNNDVSTYYIYRSKGDTANFVRLGVIDEKTVKVEFFDTDVEIGQTYYYKAASVSKKGLEGRDSEVISIVCVLPKRYFIRRKMLSAFEGDPIPIVTQYIRPYSQTNSFANWYSILDSKIEDCNSYEYSIIASADTDALLEILFGVCHNGSDWLVAHDTIHIKGTGSFGGYSNVIEGFEMPFDKGDELLVYLVNICQVDTIKVQFDGATGANSNISCPYIIVDPWATSKEFVILDKINDLEQRPVGLTFDGTDLWVTGMGNKDLGNEDTIYCVSKEGTIKTSFPSPCNGLRDLAWDGNFLWAIKANCAVYDDNGVKIPDTVDTGNIIYQLDSSGKILHEIKVPVDIAGGLTWDGFYLWGSDLNGWICKLDKSGEINQKFKSPGPNPFGLAWDGKNLWNADGVTGRIYKLDTYGNVLENYKAPGIYSTGLTWDGSNLWTVDFETYTIYKLQTAIIQ